MNVKRPDLRVAALLCCLAVLAAACGTRLSEHELLAKNSVSGNGTAASVHGTAKVDTATGGEASGPATAQESATNAAAGTHAAAGEAAASSGPTAATKTTIRIGFIASLSGAGGVVNEPYRDAWLAWAKMVNARGGIGGHPVEVLVGDDGLNDARGVAIARDFVEQKGAIALSYDGTNVTPVADYAKSKRIPIIGVIEVQPDWGTNPMLFPASGGAAGSWGQARDARVVGIKKVAILHCIEAAVCEGAANSFASAAESEGIQVVYRARISLGQPDFTGECLQARNNGAEAINTLGDDNTGIRVMQSCRRQGYNPIPLGPGNDEMAQLPEMDGMVTGGPSFPWFARSGSPGIEEYAQALKQYAPHLLTKGSGGVALAWAAAKIFEKAVENASKATGAARLTSEDILNGLWAMQGETLNGLLPGGLGRTYRREQPSQPYFCTVVNRLVKGKWVEVNGLTPSCK